MFKRMFGSGSGGGSRSRGGGSEGGSRGHGSGSADGSRDQDQWGTAGSQEVQPDTAERLRGTPQFQTDDPATSTTAEPVYYRDYTGDIDGIYLPHASSRTSAMCEKHHPIAVQRYMLLSDDVRRRVIDAKEQIARRKGNSIYEKAGRSGNRVVTKRPPSGRRIVLEWSDSPRVPIGEWATRFNNMIGCLVKRADFINPYFKFNEQPFKSFEEIWRELMKSYCLEDYPFTWDYLFGANGKVQSLLRSWRFDLKNEYYNKIEDDWERFWKLDPRVDTHHFGALLMYWDDPKILDKSSKAKANRASMEVDHFLGTQSFAQVEHKYKKKTGQHTMPINLLIAEGYTPKAGYDKATKREKLKKLKDEVDAQLAQFLHDSQTSEEGGDLDPHNLSRKQNDQIIESVFGPSKKGRRRFRGGGTWTDDNTTSSEPTMHSYTNIPQQPDDSSAIQGLLTGVIAILASRIDAAIFANIVPALYSDVPSQLPFAIQHIIVCLANRIPNEVYVDIVTYVVGVNNNQGKDTAGSTSGMHGGENENDDNDDDDDDDNDEDGGTE